MRKLIKQKKGKKRIRKEKREKTRKKGKKRCESVCGFVSPADFRAVSKELTTANWAVALVRQCAPSRSDASFSKQNSRRRSFDRI